jgi:hypothetical protein
MNASGREYCLREPNNNQFDGKEFARMTSKEVGRDFDQVIALSPENVNGIWAILGMRDNPPFIARFDGQVWSTLSEHKIFTASRHAVYERLPNGKY